MKIRLVALIAMTAACRTAPCCAQARAVVRPSIVDLPSLSLGLGAASSAIGPTFGGSSLADSVAATSGLSSLESLGISDRPFRRWPGFGPPGTDEPGSLGEDDPFAIRTTAGGMPRAPMPDRAAPAEKEPTDEEMAAAVYAYFGGAADANVLLPAIRSLRTKEITNPSIFASLKQTIAQAMTFAPVLRDTAQAGLDDPDQRLPPQAAARILEGLTLFTTTPLRWLILKKGPHLDLEHLAESYRELVGADKLAEIKRTLAPFRFETRSDDADVSEPARPTATIKAKATPKSRRLARRSRPSSQQAPARESKFRGVPSWLKSPPEPSEAMRSAERLAASLDVAGASERTQAIRTFLDFAADHRMDLDVARFAARRLVESTALGGALASESHYLVEFVRSAYYAAPQEIVVGELEQRGFHAEAEAARAAALPHLRSRAKKTS
ncbi:MAG: hypothetical protein HY078_10600 [Elusimicrobia bacterium]|nr:hypothetical protein [Elusimicrobiota bacterium]